MGSNVNLAGERPMIGHRDPPICRSVFSVRYPSDGRGMIGPWVPGWPRSRYQERRRMEDLWVWKIRRRKERPTGEGGGGEGDEMR